MKTLRFWIYLASLALLAFSVCLGQTSRAQIPVLPPGAAPTATTDAAPASNFDIELNFASSLDALASSTPGLQNLSGPAHVHVGFRGQLVNGKIARERVLTITSPDARLGRLPLGEAKLVIVSPADGSRSSLSLDIRGPVAKTLHLDLKVDLDIDIAAAHLAWKGGPVDGELRLEQIDLTKVTLAYPVLALEGTLDFRAKVTGTSDDPTLDATLDARDITYNAEPVGLVAASLKHSGKVSAIDVRWGPAGAPIATLRGKLPLGIDLKAGSLRWLDEQAMDLALKAPSITRALVRPVWYAPPGLTFDLGLSVGIQGALDNLAAEATLKGNIKSGASDNLPLNAVLRFAPSEQTLRATLGPSVMDLNLRAEAPLVAMRRAGQRAEPAPLAGTLRSTLPFSLLVPFLPKDFVDPVGVLATSFDIAGTLGDPTFSGSVNTKDAAITLLPLQQRLRDVVLETKASGNTLEITRLTGKIGLGALAGAGRVRFRATPQSGPPASGLWSAWSLVSAVAVNAAAVPLLQDGLPIGTIEGQTTLTTISVPNDTALDLSVAQGKVNVSEHILLQPSTIIKNAWVHQFDALGDVRPGHGIFAGTGHLKASLRFATPFVIAGEGNTISLTDGLTLDRQDSIVKVEGGFTVTAGSDFDLFDNPFRVISGKVTLLGGEVGARKSVDVRGGAGQATLADPDQPIRAEPFDLVVDILAEGSTVDTRVAVEIRGPWSKPELLLGSDPELPEYQILTLLITGRIDALDDADGEVRRKVAALVQRFHQPNLGRQLLDKVGLDKIGVGFGASVSEPILTVGKQVNRKLYVETVYHHNAPPDQNAREGRVELRVGPNVTVDTAFGDAAEGSLGVHWHKTFGGPVRPKLGDTISLFGKTRLPTDSDGDGLADEKDKCPLEAEDLDGFQDDDGCSDRDNDNDGTLDERDDAPDVAETRNGYRDDDGVPDSVPPRLQWEGGKIRTLELQRGSAKLTEASQSTLEAAAGVLSDFPDLKVEVTGHSDDRGGERIIQTISEARAKAVEKFLLEKGLDKARIKAEGKGAREPRDSADTEEARTANRRVEMRLVR